MKQAIIILLFALGTIPALIMISFNLSFHLEKLEEAAQQESLSELRVMELNLHNRIERLKESLISMALLPGAKDVVGYRSEVPIAREKARKRFPALIAEWLDTRPEVLEVHLFDRAGEERLRQVRTEEGRLEDVSDFPPVEDPLGEHFRQGWQTGRGGVYVSELDVDHLHGSKNTPHIYSMYLATPIRGGEEKGGVILLRLAISDFLKEYEENYWLTAEGRCLHKHAAKGPHHHESAAGEELWCGMQEKEAEDSDSLSLAGIKMSLGEGHPFIWKGKQERIAWLPVVFNPDGKPSLWVGRPVDRTAIEKWLEFFKVKVFFIGLVLVVVVYLIADRIALWADRRKSELLHGIEEILAGQEVQFGWRSPAELRQLATELNKLGARHLRIQQEHQAAREEVHTYATRLEQLVEGRTRELHEANSHLKQEIGKRIQTEEDLRRHQEHLDELVRDRTRELSDTNRRLVEEIGERHKAQQALLYNEQWLKSILDSVNIGIFIVDMESKEVVYANPAVGRLVGLDSSASLSGAKCQEFFRSGRESCPEPGSEKGSFERELTRADGTTVTVLMTVVPLQLEGRRQMVECMLDISETKKMAEENRNLQEQLPKSQKLEAVGVLAGGVAHDFNNLLTVIQGFTQLAMQRQEAQPLQHELEQIKKSAAKAADLVRQLLLFSRKQPIAPVPMNLNEAVDNLLKMLRRLIGEDIFIETRLQQEDMWLIQADPGSIDQVIMNLAVNARDAMPKGGTLVIATENIRIDAEMARRSAEARVGRFVRLEIVDSGEGMKPEVLERVFEPFYTTKEAGKGTGLGLAVVYGIIKQHGGWVEVESSPGRGTVFRLFFPAFRRLEEERKAEEFISADHLGQGGRILLVEDDEAVSRFAGAALTTSGYVVERAPDAGAALARLIAGARFDLALIDVVLPGQSGVQLAEELQERFPEMAILLASGYTDQKSCWPVIREKGFSFLQKPYTIQQLLAAVFKALPRTR